MNINCRSIVNKAAQLEALFLEHDPDIAVLTETWLNSDIYDSEFLPKNYRVLRKDRDRRGGGVAIIYKDSLQVLRMPDVPVGESLFCKLYVENVRYILGVVYRPPSSPVTFLEGLEEYLHRYVKTEDKIILAGDFNLPDIDWYNFYSQTSLQTNNTMLNIAFTFDLLQVVDDYTRIQNDSKAILDLFFVSGTIKNKVSCSVTSGISDHLAVVLTLLNVPPTNTNRIQFHPNFAMAHDEAILDALDLEYDAFRKSTCDINTLWYRFKDIIFECMQRYVPKIAKKSYKYNPWITRETLQLQRKLKRLKKKSRNSSTPSLKVKINEASSQLKHKIAADKATYYGTTLQSLITTSPERFWRLITPTSSLINNR